MSRQEKKAPFQLIIREQYWFISFITKRTKKEELQKICAKIEKKVNHALKNMSAKDLQFLQEQQQKELCRLVAANIHPKADFSLLADFKVNNFRKIGFLCFKVKFDTDELLQYREKIRPSILQAIAYKINTLFKSNLSDEFSFDDKSPPLVFSISTDYNYPKRIKWTDEKIEEHKVELGKWIELFSGQWHDYSERLYNNRIQNQLSNRTSELHFINRNSGLIYMKPKNYEDFFESYIKPKVLLTAIELRTVLFAQVKIETLLNNYLQKFYDREFERKKLGQIEEEIEIIDTLKIDIDMLISEKLILLSYNLRQHYSAVNRLLMNLYDIEKNSQRLDKKFNEITDRLAGTHNQISQFFAEEQEKSLNMLNLILGLSVVIELLTIVLTNNQTIIIINSIFLGLVGIYLFYYFIRSIYIEFYRKK